MNESLLILQLWAAFSYFPRHPVLSSLLKSGTSSHCSISHHHMWPAENSDRRAIQAASVSSDASPALWKGVSPGPSRGGGCAHKYGGLAEALLNLQSLSSFLYMMPGTVLNLILKHRPPLSSVLSQPTKRHSAA